MRKFLIAMLVIPALVASGAPPTLPPEHPVDQAVPGLKAYVSQLNAKKNQQQTPAEISKYRSELSRNGPRRA